MVMTPAQLHIHVEVEFSAGQLLIVTVGDPGVQGEDVTGIHGWGVNTPIAADVAAATWGFAKLLHIPKEVIFTMGLCSIIVATGLLMALTRFVGRTCKLEGITPKEHINVAPTITNCGIPLPSLVFTPKHIRIMCARIFLSTYYRIAVDGYQKLLPTVSSMSMNTRDWVVERITIAVVMSLSLFNK